MLSIGLDIGTGFVKCVSDIKKIKFPSLYAYKWIEEWNKTKKLVEAVGDEAVTLSYDPDTIVIKPVMLGKPVHEKAFVELVKKAVLIASENKDAMDSKPDNIAIGLPYDASSHRTSMQKIITKLYKPKACDVVPQVLGTLTDAGQSSAVVMSIGQGTTEIVAFMENKAIRGMSVHHAVGYISSKFGEMSYLDIPYLRIKEPVNW
jgi:actin-like ATPase involved in cell morphogenesis